MPLSKGQRKCVKDVYKQMDEHVMEMLEAAEALPNDEIEDSINLAKIERAICVYVLNNNKEKAEKKLNQYSEAASEMLEDILENRDESAIISTHHNKEDETKVFESLGKDEEYKNICDMLMKKKRCYEMFVNSI